MIGGRLDTGIIGRRGGSDRGREVEDEQSQLDRILDVALSHNGICLKTKENNYNCNVGNSVGSEDKREKIQGLICNITR